MLVHGDRMVCGRRTDGLTVTNSEVRARIPKNRSVSPERDPEEGGDFGEAAPGADAVLVGPNMGPNKYNMGPSTGGSDMGQAGISFFHSGAHGGGGGGGGGGGPGAQAALPRVIRQLDVDSYTRSAETSANNLTQVPTGHLNQVPAGQWAPNDGHSDGRTFCSYNIEERSAQM